MLKIDNLQVSIQDKAILRGINLVIGPGEVHAIMGPNGSGKSTLAKVLAGHEAYKVTQGEVNFNQQSLLSLTPEARAQLGLFLAFQYPVEIPGVSNVYLLKAAYNARRSALGLPELDAVDFLSLVRSKIQLLDMDQDLLYRFVNTGFSGGEKKRNEILQLLLLEPDLAILDEPDSGLDIDALQYVAKGVNAIRSKERSVLMITHYQRILDFVVPDFVHVLYDGKIIKSGDKTLAYELEAKGYQWLIDGIVKVSEEGLRS